MVIVNNAEAYSEYFTSCNDKGWEVLLKLLNHPIDEHLSNSTEYSHYEHMEQKYFMLKQKGENIDNFHEDT